jgi:hypothetical protein
MAAGERRFLGRRRRRSGGDGDGEREEEMRTMLFRYQEPR